MESDEIVVECSQTTAFVVGSDEPQTAAVVECVLHESGGSCVTPVSESVTLNGIRLVEYTDSDVSPSEKEDDVYSPITPCIEFFAANALVSANQVDPAPDPEVYHYNESNVELNSDDASISDGFPHNESEEEGSKDGELPESCVTVYTRSAHGRGKDRRLPCFYCGKFVYHVPRHLQKKHSSEPQVAALVRSSDRRLGLQYITNLGMYKHNSSVLKDGDGVLIVARTPKLNRSSEDFLPCHSENEN